MLTLLMMFGPAIYACQSYMADGCPSSFSSVSSPATRKPYHSKVNRRQLTIWLQTVMTNHLLTYSAAMFYYCCAAASRRLRYHAISEMSARYQRGDCTSVGGTCTGQLRYLGI